MATFGIQYQNDHHKLADFETYARNWPEPIRRCSGELHRIFSSDEAGGSTNIAIALIRFKNLTVLLAISRSFDERP
jgi:NIPSNAP protein